MSSTDELITPAVAQGLLHVRQVMEASGEEQHRVHLSLLGDEFICHQQPTATIYSLKHRGRTDAWLSLFGLRIACGQPDDETIAVRFT